MNKLKMTNRKNRNKLVVFVAILILILLSDWVIAEKCEEIGSFDKTLKDDKCEAKIHDYLDGTISVYIETLKYDDSKCNPGETWKDRINEGESKTYCEDKCTVVNIPTAGAIAKACLEDITTGPNPKCSDICDWPLSEEECRAASKIVVKGCWFDKSLGPNECWNCDGKDGHGVTKCEDYTKTDCMLNPCEISSGCGWDGSECVASTAKTCSEICKTWGVCSETECRNADKIVPGGCWFDKSLGPNECWNCDGKDGHGVDSCEDYTETDCMLNPCKLAGGCGWDGSKCVASTTKTCSEICKTWGVCSEDECRNADAIVPGHCWFDKSLGPNECWNCDGKDGHGVTKCEDYTETDCLLNPCKLAGGCGWDAVEKKCIKSGTSTHTCNEICKTWGVCSKTECDKANIVVPDGCWFEGAWGPMPNNCWNCDGSDGKGKGIDSCDDYPKEICVDNPCRINLPDGCELKGENCVKIGEKPPSPGIKIETCSCYCTTCGKTITITAHGATPEGCAEACGGICGGYADYEKDLNKNCDNCESYCNNNLVCAAYKNKCKEGCKTSCESVCGLNETIYGITDVMYYIAVIIAAIMFVISGYKFITSTNPEDRDEAKKMIMYVILALMLIIIASSLVKLFIGSVSCPQ